jgi:hypothetical protein
MGTNKEEHELELVEVSSEWRHRLTGPEPDTAASALIFRLDKPKLTKMTDEEKGTSQRKRARWKLR